MSTNGQQHQTFSYFKVIQILGTLYHLYSVHKTIH